MAVVCHNCGGENEEGREWCSRCGAPLEAPAVRAATPSAGSATAAPAVFQGEEISITLQLTEQQQRQQIL
ncbi:MAG: hypothetical protein KKF41_03910, partial [Actinobacteria bacterium]|nr:hypothetical protein [Actinomycetota bacterium]